MPDYEFYCHACMKTFSKVLTRTEYEEGEVLCPHCSSDNVEQSWPVFYPVTSKKAPENQAPGTAPKVVIDRAPPRA
jgi:putative FmdB family regulatory protein